jgi:hypothetical protein
MSYGGESNAKKIARLRVWLEMLRHTEKTKDVRESRALVLAGPEAGDIRALMALGVLPENITAVDVDPEALESSRRIVPAANYVLGDVLKVVSKKRRKKKTKRYDMVFLDYCSPISERAVQKSVRVAKEALVNNGYFCTGFMYGREGPGAREGVSIGRETFMESVEMLRDKIIAPTPAILRNMVDNGVDMSNGDFYSLAEAISRGPESFRGKNRQVIEKALNITARVSYLQNRMLDNSLKHGMVLFNTGYFAYRSGRRTKSGHSSGVPMIYYLSRGLQFLGKLPKKRLKRHYLTEASKFDMEEAFCVGHLPDDPDGEGLRRCVMSFARKSGSAYAADLFNLNKRTVAAWLAWDTMRRSEGEA